MAPPPVLAKFQKGQVYYFRRKGINFHVDILFIKAGNKLKKVHSLHINLENSLRCIGRINNS